VETEHYSEFLFDRGVVASIRFAKDAATAGSAAIECHVDSWPRLYVKDLEQGLGECRAKNTPLDAPSMQTCTFALPTKRERQCDVDAVATVIHADALLDTVSVRISGKPNSAKKAAVFLSSVKHQARPQTD
jgi:hypothetical protein